MKRVLPVLFGVAGAVVVTFGVGMAIDALSKPGPTEQRIDDLELQCRLLKLQMDSQKEINNYHHNLHWKHIEANAEARLEMMRVKNSWALPHKTIDPTATPETPQVTKDPGVLIPRQRLPLD